MAIDYDKLMAWPFEDVRHRYTQRDTIWRLLSLVVIVYLLYGLYTIWSGGYEW